MGFTPRYNQSVNNSTQDPTAAEQIDAILKMHGGWKGNLLSSLRDTIRQTDPKIYEEIKWKMKNRPEGLPVWSYNGIICFAEIWKDNVKLLFPKGALLKDPKSLFNARLQSKDIRAIEYREGDDVDESGLTELVTEAAKLNDDKVNKK